MNGAEDGVGKIRISKFELRTFPCEFCASVLKGFGEFTAEAR